MFFEIGNYFDGIPIKLRISHDCPFLCSGEILPTRWAMSRLTLRILTDVVLSERGDGWMMDTYMGSSLGQIYQACPYSKVRCVEPKFRYFPEFGQP